MSQFIANNFKPFRLNLDFHPKPNIHTVMEKFLDILWYAMYYTRNILLTIWWVVSIFTFVILISGSVYYFVKPDLPPQEIWELSKEFFPTQIEQIKNNTRITQVLQYVEIDTNYVPSYAIDDPNQWLESGQVWDFDPTHLAPALEDIGFIASPQ